MMRFLSVAVLAFVLATPAFAAQPKTYQVTGIVLSLSEDLIVVEKGKAKDTERWEIARNADTKITGELKVGEKVTIEYRMTATTVEVKTEKAK